jgi:Cu2+-exporting ATPase
MVGNGVGAKNGILFKNAASLEKTSGTEIIALDKTGTITCGTPEVTDLFPAEGFNENALLTLACALEKKSEHPLAGAIVRKAEENNISVPEVSGFQALPGSGVTAILDGNILLGGSFHFITEQIPVNERVQKQAERISESGKTPLLFVSSNTLVGIIAVADVVREESAGAVQELQKMGIRVVMLTGDNERTANAIAAQTGVDEVIAGVHPDGKALAIRKLKQQGKVAMVGDGINDAPALTEADTGIAIGAGADIAIDAADLVLMKNSLRDVPAAIRLSRAVLRNIHQNLFWAFFYNVIGIPLAAGIWIPLFHWQLTPMFGAAAMSLSSVCVISNALRLNLISVHDASHDKKRKNKKHKHNKEEKVMKTTMRIEGMMCAHCEGRVKKVLEALPDVETAVVSHTDGTAVLTLKSAVGDEILRSTVEEQGYTVTDIVND